MILVSGRRERFPESKLGDCRLVRQQSFRLCGLHTESSSIASWLREPEIDKLEHRFQIRSRAAAVQSFFQLADKRTRRSNFSHHKLSQVDGIELAYTAS